MKDADKAGLPPIAVSPNFGKLLMMLAQSIGAKNVLEIGTLAGYSTIWLAQGLASGGKIVTLEADSKRAQLAQANFVSSGRGEVD